MYKSKFNTLFEQIIKECNIAKEGLFTGDNSISIGCGNDVSGNEVSDNEVSPTLDIPMLPMEDDETDDENKEEGEEGTDSDETEEDTISESRVRSKRSLTRVRKSMKRK